MKYINPAIFSLLVLSVLTTGCLKDKDYDDGKIQSVRSRGDQKIVEISLTATTTDNYLAISMDNSNNDTSFNLVPVTLASGSAAEEDIKVTLLPNPSLIGNYNALHGTINELAPASVYTIENPPAPGGGYIVTIAKGTNIGYLRIKIKPSDYLGKAYALAYQISAIEPGGYTISSNLSSGIASIGIKNKYDGVYTVDETSVMVDIVNPAFNSVPGDPYPFDIYLITLSGNSNVMFIPGTGYYHLIPGNSIFGEFAPIFRFDATPADPNTDDIVAVNNYYGDPSPTRARSGEIDITGINKVYANGDMDVTYKMLQGGSMRTTFTEHFVYKGPRP